MGDECDTAQNNTHRKVKSGNACGVFGVRANAVGQVLLNGGKISSPDIVVNGCHSGLHFLRYSPHLLAHCTQKAFVIVVLHDSIHSLNQKDLFVREETSYSSLHLLESGGKLWVCGKGFQLDRDSWVILH